MNISVDAAVEKSTKVERNTMGSEEDEAEKNAKNIMSASSSRR